MMKVKVFSYARSDFFVFVFVLTAPKRSFEFKVESFKYICLDKIINNSYNIFF